MMGFIDDDDGAAFLGTVFEQLFREPQTQRLFLVAVKGQAEIVKDGLQKGGALGEMAVRQERAGGIFTKTLKEDIAEQRFAAARFAGQQDQTLILGNAAREG